MQEPTAQEVIGYISGYPVYLIAGGADPEVEQRPDVQSQADDVGAETQTSQELDAELTDSELSSLDAKAQAYISRLRNENASRRTRARELEEQIEAWGGADYVSDLHRLANTEDGIRELFHSIVTFEGGGRKAADILQIPQDRLDALLAKAEQQTQQEASKIEAKTGQTLTLEEAEQIAERKVQEALQRELGRRDEVSQAQTLRASVYARMAEAGFTDPVDTAEILMLGAQTESQVKGRTDQERMLAATDEGIRLFKERQERRLEEYLRRKAGNGNVPQGLGNGSPPTGEPIDMRGKSREESHRLAREMLGLER